MAKEIDGKKVILPIWYDITKEDVLKYSPTLADKFALSIPQFNLEEICEQLAFVFQD